MKYYSDGFTNGSNPSKTGGGYSIVDENNTLLVLEKIEKKGFTNNEAELLGLFHALTIADRGSTISTDSKNTLAWVFQKKKKKKHGRPDLIPCIKECSALIEEKHISVIWEPRELNLAGIFNDEKGLDTARPVFEQKPVAIPVAIPEMGDRLNTTTLMESLEILKGKDYSETKALDFEDIVVTLLNKKGKTRRRVFVEDRGDGRRGKVDILYEDEKGTVGIEVDYATPRKKSIFKLQSMNVDRRVVLLRAPFAIIEIL